jgi:hypothetical protein
VRSWDYANKLEARLKAEVEKLLELAETATGQEHRGLDIAAELARREERLKKMAQAKAEIERGAKERYMREKAQYDEKRARRRKSGLGKSRVEAHPKSPSRVRTTKTRSTSPMKNRASCRYPVVVLNRLITARSGWRGTGV